MSRSLKTAHILLVAAFAAALSACSAGGDSSAPTTAPAVSAAEPTATSTAETTSAEPPAEPEAATASTAPAATASIESPNLAASAEPTAGAQGDGAGDTGPAMHLIGVLSASPTQPGWITVQLDEGDTQEVMLSPDAVVLDIGGTICNKGKLPHRCTVAQLEKAFRARKAPYAKVTIQGGVAMRIEELVER
ncbi:hypothetical protein [Streptosporangium sp. NPDC087985]|uniref:hypothetical protein n=1 Tax=Streptosporangium sp. NPDC087985 TaxID=3366196 RepID=UPI0037F58D6C